MGSPNRFALALGLTFCGCQAVAQDYYVGGNVSYHDADDLSLDAGPVLDELTLDRGIGIALSVGGRLNPTLRWEGELAQRRADGDSLPLLGLEDLDGRVEATTLMVNLIADFTIDGTRLQPFLGIGAGWATLELDDVGNRFLRFTAEDDSALTAQAFAGLSYPLSERLLWTADLRYNYIRANDLDVDVIPGTRFDSETRWRSLSIGTGLRYQF